MSKQSIGFGLLVSLMAFQAVGAESYGPTEQESKLLPPYCQGSQDWRAILGPDAGWNNHTCYGINRLNRYYKSRSAQEKKDHLSIALDDFNYSVGHLKPDFPVMPEIYMYRGITYALMNRNGEAVADLSKAVNMNPKLTRAYSELANIYESNFKQPAKTLEVVSEGLRHNPQTKSLQLRYTRLGGKLPFPEPFAATNIAAKEVKPLADQPGSDMNATEVKPPEALKSSTEKPTNGSSNNKEEKDTASTQKAAETMGSPSSPWCRFCPDAAPQKK